MTLINQTKQFLNDTGTSQAKLAREAGINSGALSAYLNENYRGNIAEIEAKLTAYFGRQAIKKREFVEAPPFIETTTAKQIFKTLEFAQIANCMATIYGASGVGKTKAIQQFASRQANVWLVTASPSRSSLSEMLYEIALELGINDAPRRKGMLSRLITRKIKGTEGLLIIDEADHLPYDALEELRIMQEEAGIGLVLGTIYNEQDPVPVQDPEMWLHKFSNGTIISHHRQTGEVVVSTSGKVSVTAKVVEITAPCKIIGDVTIQGNLKASGKITSSQEVSAPSVKQGAISLGSHVHGGVESGNKRSGTPE